MPTMGSGPTAALTNNIAVMKAAASEAAVWREVVNMVFSLFSHPTVGDTNLIA